MLVRFTEKSTCSKAITGPRSYWISSCAKRKCDGGGGRQQSATFFLLSVLPVFFALFLTLGRIVPFRDSKKFQSAHTCIRSKAHAAEIQRPLVGRNIKIMCKVEFLWPPFLRLLRPAESGHRRRFPFWSLCSACLLLCPPQRSCVLYF